MEYKRFRNHFSSVIEQLGAAFVLVFFCIIGNADDLLKMIIEISKDNFNKNILYVAAGFAVVFIVMTAFIMWRVWIWSKTWIVIGDETISIEKNTLNSSKNTIGLKNISNVNTEQNIFEIIMGTCKVKLDTNSLSTANTTDVKIILKKKQAEELRIYLTKRVNGITNNADTDEALPVLEDRGYDIKADLKDILFNGLYSINVAIVLIFLGSVLFMIGSIMELVQNNVDNESVGGILTAALGALFMAATTFSGMISGFVKLFGFMSKREDDKIYIKYGLLKRMNYTIPVDKINAVIIHQTFIARICHKYSAEIINVGMDDENDSTAYFTFYCSKEKMTDVIDKIIPEFSEAVRAQVNGQPKSAWAVKGLMFLWCELFFLIGLGFAVNFTDMPLFLGVIVTLIFTFIQIVCYIMSFITAGRSIQANYLGLRSGMFGTHYVIIKFNKVQYVSLKQNIITKKLGIINGSVKILASLGKTAHTVPYIREEECRLIEKGLSSR